MQNDSITTGEKAILKVLSQKISTYLKVIHLQMTSMVLSNTYQYLNSRMWTGVKLKDRYGRGPSCEFQCRTMTQMNLPFPSAERS